MSRSNSLGQKIDFKGVLDLFRSSAKYASITCVACKHSSRVVLAGEYGKMNLSELQARLVCSKCKARGGEAIISNESVVDVVRKFEVPITPKGFKDYFDSQIDMLAATKARESAIENGEDWKALTGKRSLKKKKAADRDLKEIELLSCSGRTSGKKA
ncbi:hypothetical protein [Hyphomonas sp.]|uniref:hypothetical protein n=1 Tax=Hyphomonas sp. TaxID=87 RepID=UPI0039187884